MKRATTPPVHARKLDNPLRSVPTHFPHSLTMINEKQEFIEALHAYVSEQLRLSAEPADYNSEAIRIVDARNHLFANVGRRRTDEELGIYAIRDLCRVDEDTMEVVPDRMRFQAIAKDYF